MFDRAWIVRIGSLGRYEAEAEFASLPEAIDWLRKQAVALHPESTFAKLWRHGF